MSKEFHHDPKCVALSSRWHRCKDRGCLLRVDGEIVTGQRPSEASAETRLIELVESATQAVEEDDTAHLGEMLVCIRQIAERLRPRTKEARNAVPCTCPNPALHERECPYLLACAPYGRCARCTKALTLPPSMPGIGPDICGDCYRASPRTNDAQSGPLCPGCGWPRTPQQSHAESCPVARGDGARCHRCGHYETSYERAASLYAHCPSCSRHTRWERVPNDPRTDSAKPVDEEARGKQVAINFCEEHLQDASPYVKARLAEWFTQHALRTKPRTEPPVSAESDEPVPDLDDVRVYGPKDGVAWALDAIETVRKWSRDVLPVWRDVCRVLREDGWDYPGKPGLLYDTAAKALETERGRKLWAMVHGETQRGESPREPFPGELELLHRQIDARDAELVALRKVAEAARIVSIGVKVTRKCDREAMSMLDAAIDEYAALPSSAVGGGVK